jgi:hypothetical protein
LIVGASGNAQQVVVVAFAAQVSCHLERVRRFLIFSLELWRLTEVRS